MNKIENLDFRRNSNDFRAKGQSSGLGESGEVYLVGSDSKMRSLARKFSEDSEFYIKNLKALGTSLSSIENIREKQTTTITQEIKTPAVKSAFSVKRNRSTV